MTLLGYSFRYKESEVVDDHLHVRFFHGVSKGYPQVYANRRDFSCEAVYAGDTSQISMDDSEMLSLFRNIQLNQGIERLREVWERHYASTLTFDDYVSFDAVIQTDMELALRHIARYDHQKVMEWAGIGEKTYKTIRDVVNARYEREIHEALR